ncbi:DUF6586 family protein [Marinobacterium marinum]|uniref:PasA protein n=1 Tax=Marinobacterium marinum TaxID=2756129 RepID=A0A7W1WXH8_9GAMM|nr:DUF6586 family protein [Marinobacterium marinum]MBA4501919.1 hypothetical protein [Marinobacterium marinum]
MSEIYAVRTNQKLNFARLHIKALVQAQEAPQWSQNPRIESYHESVLFFLASGYAALLREIAENYNLTPTGIHCHADLLEQMEATGQESPEVRELEQLESDRNSWLHKMLQAYRSCWEVAGGSVKVTAAGSSVSEIHVLQVNPDHAEDAEVLKEYNHWLQAFRELLERLRANMQEW